MSQSATFEITLGRPPSAATYRVLSLRGRERLSKPYVFDVLVGDADIDERTFSERALGAPAMLTIHGAAGPRLVRGVVQRCASVGLPSHERAAFEVRIVPRLATLEHRRRSRIFQDKTLPEIVSAVFSEAGILDRWETERTYPRRAYCVQYEETDLEFIHRLLAEVGLFYRFEHLDETIPAHEPETIVFADSPRYALIEGDPKLLHRVAQAGSSLALEEHHVTRFHRARRAAPSSYHRRDYDFERPLTPLTATASASSLPGEGEVYEHHGELSEPEAEQRLEHVALAQLRRDVDRARGESACARLVVGCRFTLAEHELGSHDGDYLVTSVEHRGRAPESAGRGPTYTNRFACVPADTTYRPRRLPRQFRQAMETAVVTGPSGHEIHTDALGRVKVQFHWDRDGKRDERSSCFLRVAQSWAGGGFGFQFVPRVGMEVLVGFLGGDPDRPIIVGAVANTTQPVPYPLPENQTKSGIRTQSTPGGGGFNEISFNDAKGGELLEIRAERNLTESAQNDHRVSVGRDQGWSVAGDRSAEVKGEDALRVEGAYSLSVGGPSKVFLGGGSESQIKGARVASVAGDDTTRVSGGHTVLAAEYSHLLIGHGAPEGHGLVYVNGSYRIGAVADVQISAMKGLTLTCGDSSIELTPGEIRLKSPKITMVAKDEMLARGKEHEIALTDHMELRGTDIRLFAKQGQLLLDDDARLNGQLIKLNCDKPAAEKKDLTDREEKGTITFRVKPHFEVRLGDKLVAVIAAPTGEVLEREVDANMEVRIEGKKGDHFTLIDLRKGELPVGKRGA